MKKFFSKVMLFFLLVNLQAVFAFEDYIVISDGKLTDINIEDNKVIDVYPLITIMNDKNTLIFHPLKEGKTKVSVLKDKKDLIEFNVVIENGFTKIEKVLGVDILSLDKPPISSFSDFEEETLPLIFPPTKLGEDFGWIK